MSQAIIVKPEENIKQIQDQLLAKGVQDQIGTALSTLKQYVSPEKMVRVALTAIRGDEKLAISTPISIIGSVIQLAQVGLVPDGFLGQAYLVPYFNKELKRFEASPLIGYRGYGELAIRSGKADSVDAHTIYEGDLFEYEYGDKPWLKYRLQMDPKKRGNIIGAYAIVYMKEGPHRFEVMAIDQIEKVKGASEGADSSYSPWKKWYEEMVRKTPMRRLAKWVPLSPEFQLAAGIDEAAELGTQRTVIDNATGQVYFVPTGRPTEDAIERPGRTSEAKTEEKGSATTENGHPVVEGSATTTNSKCLCNCCKTGECNCATLDEFQRCGCTPCVEKVKGAVAPTAAASEAKAEPKAEPEPPKDEGPYVPVSKLGKLFVAAASAGIKVVKDSQDDELHKMLKEKFGITSLKRIPQARFNDILQAIAPNLKVQK